MPQEAGINERAVSFTKGCYIGQETVARLHYKGKPNRHLRLLDAGRARRRGRRGQRSTAASSGRSAPRSSPPPADRSRSRSCAARPSPGPRCSSEGEPSRGRGDLRRPDVSTPRRGGPPIGLGGRPMDAGSPLLGGSTRGGPPRPRPRPRARAGLRPRRRPAGDEPAELARAGGRRCPIEQLRELLPETEPDRSLDDWGRSERPDAARRPAAQLLLPLLVPGRGRGDRERARRPAARCSSATTRARCRRTRR